MSEVLTGLTANWAFPNAVIYSGNSSFWVGLGAWGKDALKVFGESFNYYLFGEALTPSTISSLVMFFVLVVAVAFISALLLGGWFNAGVVSRAIGFLRSKK